MLKRLVFALLAIGLLLGGAVPAYAAQTGSIRVVPETKPPADSAVTLYHAGVEADGGYCLRRGTGKVGRPAVSDAGVVAGGA